MKFSLLALSLCILPVNASTEIKEKSSVQKAYELGGDIGHSMGAINVICTDVQFDRGTTKGSQMLIKGDYEKLAELMSPSEFERFIKGKIKDFPKCAEILPLKP
tara:strand:+ start:690 stop:1001 length:312 start_codon:yes stop_codon:yes gene_type:complete